MCLIVYLKGKYFIATLEILMIRNNKVQREGAFAILYCIINSNRRQNAT